MIHIYLLELINSNAQLLVLLCEYQKRKSKCQCRQSIKLPMEIVC